MQKLYEIYKMYSDDTSYCPEPKLHFKETSEKILFFQPSIRYFDFVIAGDSIDEVSNTITHPPTCMKSAAATLWADVLLYCSAIKAEHWPQTIETVTAKYGPPPDSAKLFLKTPLCGKKNIDKLDAHPRLVESFYANFVHAVRKGEANTPRHYLLSLGHNKNSRFRLSTNLGIVSATQKQVK